MVNQWFFSTMNSRTETHAQFEAFARTWRGRSSSAKSSRYPQPDEHAWTKRSKILCWIIIFIRFQHLYLLSLVFSHTFFRLCSREQLKNLETLWPTCCGCTDDSFPPRTPKRMANIPFGKVWIRKEILTGHCLDLKSIKWNNIENSTITHVNAQNALNHTETEFRSAQEWRHTNPNRKSWNKTYVVSDFSLFRC